MNIQAEIDRLVEELWWAGFGAHKASLDPRNSNGIRALEEKAQNQSKKEPLQLFDKSVERWLLSEGEDDILEKWKNTNPSKVTKDFTK